MTYVILQGNCLDVLKTIPSNIIQTCVTSPPYFGLRDYNVQGQLGLEPTPQAYVDSLVQVFREVRRTLRDDGTLWLNLGDSYASAPKGNPGARGNINGGKRDTAEADRGSTIDKSKLPGLKPKDLIGIPWMVAFALQQDGWYLRQDIIWHKPNPMPESVRDRCTKAHEYIFLLSKSEKYFFDAEAMREDVAESQRGRVRTNDPVGGKSWQERDQHSKGGGYTTMRAKDNSDSARNPNSRPHSLSKFEADNGRNYETRNRRSVWTVTTKPFKEAHFATFPPDLIRPCILAGAAPNSLVLDPFGGAGTTALVSEQLGRHSISIELNPDYVTMARARVEAPKTKPVIQPLDSPSHF